MSKRRRFPIQTIGGLPDWVAKPEKQRIEPEPPRRKPGDPLRCDYQLPEAMVPPAHGRRVTCDRTKHEAGKHKAIRFVHGFGEISWQWTH